MDRTPTLDVFTGWIPVWSRNFLFWRKLALASIFGNLGEPVLYLLALGLGLGALVGTVGETPYLAFLASGFVCSSCMMTATFESTYSAYSRMSEQRTWDGMLSTPLSLRDIVVGEIIWAASKALLSATGVLLVAAGFGVVSGPIAILVPVICILVGVCFASLGLLVSTFAKSYDFFLFYTTLFVTPMFLLSGVFFPAEQMPEAIQTIANLLPLTHAVELI